MPKNQTVRKSDNQEVKEETFIQTERRGGEGQLWWEDTWQDGRVGEPGSPSFTCR